MPSITSIFKFAILIPFATAYNRSYLILKKIYTREKGQTNVYLFICNRLLISILGVAYNTVKIAWCLTQALEKTILYAISTKKQKKIYCIYLTAIESIIQEFFKHGSKELTTSVGSVIRFENHKIVFNPKSDIAKING
jgi:hypothetical protein